jgi:uncharacterized protein (DUF1499 family)
MAGLGTRAGLWSFGTGFSVLRWAAYIGIAAALLALLFLLILRPRGATLAALGLALLLGTITVALPWQQRRTARSVPPIHDITTDLGDPPTFVAILPLRADAPNSAEYEGEEVAAQQRAAYPDIAPLFLETTPATAFTQALDAARAMGWEIVAADSTAGRIEATATTRWFGFKDDVVVRITADGSRSRVDVRSVSRVGRSDVGANAARIRKYLARLRP